MRQRNLRDVGVAGSNPVTPTIDLIRIFRPPSTNGSRSKRFTVPKTVPVSAWKNHTMIRLSLDAYGREPESQLHEGPHQATWLQGCILWGIEIEARLAELRRLHATLIRRCIL
jgi:hypothetical protein